MNKFENVDVLASLQQIMQQNTAAFQNDFDIDKKILTRAAKSKNAEDKVYLWFSRPNGTHCLRERDVFLRGTREHNTPKAYGHCSTKKIWKSENDGQYEINIGAEFLNRPSANTAATMCHEMVHLYCLVNEIQDTCQKGRYHNKTFKAEAEARDLEIGYDRTVGFSHTNPTEAFKKTLEDNGFVLEVPFARVMPEEKAKAEREKPHRYVCPVCGQEVKTTADLSLICGICEVAMERAD